MPQEFYVLKCFSCETFQVHIVKKAKKWECKMCGAKQSLKRNYGKGSSKDCRNQVMKLNELRLSKCNISNQIENDTFEETDWTEDLIEQQVKEEQKDSKPSISKWAEYVEETIPDTESEAEENEENLIMNFVDKKKKRMKKRFEDYSKNKKVCRESSESEAIEAITTIHEETNELYSSPNNEKTIEFSNENEGNSKSKNIQLKSEPKFGKYAKYLEDEEDNNDLSQKVYKSNIFESDINDLDDVLSF